MGTKRKLTSRLPSLPVYPEVREQLVEIAVQEGKSIGQLQREALALFFADRDTKRITNRPQRVKEKH